MSKQPIRPWETVRYVDIFPGDIVSFYHGVKDGPHHDVNKTTTGVVTAVTTTHQGKIMIDVGVIRTTGYPSEEIVRYT